MNRFSASDFERARTTLWQYRNVLEGALKAVVPTGVDVYENQVLTPGIRPISVNHRQLLLLRRSPDLFLDATQLFRLVADPSSPTGFHIALTEYIYELSTSRTGGGTRVVAFHWHPNSETSPYRFPHTHLGSGAGQLAFDLTGAHLPSGRVLLEDVLELAITHFKVQPAPKHWPQVVRPITRAFRQERDVETTTTGDVGLEPSIPGRSRWWRTRACNR